MTKPLEQQEARRLRREHGLPMKVIAKRLGVSPASVYAWTRDIEISAAHAARNMERSRTKFSRTWAEKHREKRRRHQERGRSDARRGDPLHHAGCMLYWAEGGKRRNVLQFCNSDPHMLAFFRRFLCECFDVDPADLKLRLHVYLNGDLTLDEIEDFWIEKLDLPKSSLRGHSINPLPTSSSGKKKNRLPYGVGTLYLYDTSIVQRIYGAIQEYGGFDEPRWLDGPKRKKAA
jgi:hypothetical protein